MLDKQCAGYSELNCLSRGFIAMIKLHGQKQLGEEGVNFILQLSGHGQSMREVRAGTQAGRWRHEGLVAYWLCSMAYFVQAAFLYTQDCQPRGGTTSVINQENDPQARSGQSDGDIFSIEVSSFQMTRAASRCQKLTRIQATSVKAHIYICMYVCMHILHITEIYTPHMYICIYMHTYTCTHVYDVCT